MGNGKDCGCGGGNWGNSEPSSDMPLRIECVRTAEKCKVGNKPGHIYKCGDVRVCIPDELGLVDGDVIQFNPCELVQISAVKMQVRERAEGMALLLDAPRPVMYIIKHDPQTA